MNDITSFLDGVEVNVLSNIQNGTSENNLTHWLVGAVYDSLGLSEFALRLFNPIVLILTFVGFYFMSKKIFGTYSSIYTLLILGSSLLLPNISKLINGDVMLFAAQLFYFLATIYALKFQTITWKIAQVAIAIIGASILPQSMFVVVFLMHIALYFTHKNGKSLLIPGIASLIAIPLVAVLTQGSVFGSEAGFMLKQISVIKRYGFLLLSMLPFLGLIGAGFIDMSKKMRKGEELSTLIFVWIVAGVVDGGFFFLSGLAFLSAKQLMSYLHPNYPYKTIIKGYGIVHLVLFFCVAILGMLNAQYAIGKVGYQAIMMVTCVYWIPSLVSVFGMYGFKKAQMEGGMILAGLLFSFFFWLHVNPILENQRQVSRQLSESTDEYLEDFEIKEVYQIGAVTPGNLQLYMQDRAELQITAVDNINDPRLSANTKKVIIIPDSIYADFKVLYPNKAAAKSFAGLYSFDGLSRNFVVND